MAPTVTFANDVDFYKDATIDEYFYGVTDLNTREFEN